MKKQAAIIALSISVIAALFLIAYLSTSARAAVDWAAKVDQSLLADVAAGSEAEFLVVLNEQANLNRAAQISDKTERGRYVYKTMSELAARTQAPLHAILDERGVAYRPYWANNMIWVRGDQSIIQTLASRRDVFHIYANNWNIIDLPQAEEVDLGHQPEAIEWGISKVNAPAVWDLGYTGQGAVIGGQDTGYEWTHPALKGKYRGWDGTLANHDYNWHDAIHSDITGNGTNPCGFNATAPCDDHGHGTHTMGTMAGEATGQQIGMAPNAKWIGCRNMEEGAGTAATYTECYEWFIAPYPVGGDPFNDGDPSKAPDVINNSWGCPPSEGCTTANILLSVVQAVRAAGIITVHSAGNSGPSCSTVSDPAAIYDESFSVGATTSSDVLASFSSRGPVTIDGSGRMKPDIAAPGVGVRSSIPGGGYSSMSGTSMAGPHVAGLVALIISVNPALAGDVDTLEEVITQSAHPLTVGENPPKCGADTATSVPNNYYGWGRIDALAAYNIAIQIEPEPTQTPTQTNTPPSTPIVTPPSTPVSTPEPGSILNYFPFVTH